MEKVMGFFRDEEGATAVEYGIMVALIAVAVIATVFAVGEKLNDIFEKVESGLGKAG